MLDSRWPLAKGVVIVVRAGLGWLHAPPLRRGMAPWMVLLGLLGLSLLATSHPTQATPIPGGELEQRCWQRNSRERTKVDTREPMSVQFSNLRDGYVVRSPFLVEFAVRGMGVAPAGVQAERTGHHHLLINKALPPSVTAPIPFDDKHRHFGKGQTATLLDLPAGKHTLRLLFADHEHRPYFVFSREITVQVVGPRERSPAPRIDAANFEGTCGAWYQDYTSSPRAPGEPLYFANLRANESLASPFNLRVGVEGLGVSPKGSGAANTGHFVVDLLEAPSGRPLQSFELRKGATQVDVVARVGEYRLRLRMLDDKGRDLLPAHDIPIRVLTAEPI
jgi:hypothetical protein